MCAQMLYEVDPECEPEPDPNSAHRCREIDEDPDRRAALLLVALAECPFKAASDADAAPVGPLPLPRQRRALDKSDQDAALAAITFGAALARRGQGTATLSAALAQPQGLGTSVRALRERAAAGDATARRAVNELDMARQHAGVTTPQARARRLRQALELPETCGESRRCALEEAAALCGDELSSQALDGEPEPGGEPPLPFEFDAGREPDDEEGLEALDLLERARSELGLQQVLETGEVEL